MTDAHRLELERLRNRLGADDFPMIQALDAVLAEAPRQYPHWQCLTHGRFNAYVAVGCPECVRELRDKLKPSAQRIEVLEALLTGFAADARHLSLRLANSIMTPDKLAALLSVEDVRAFHMTVEPPAEMPSRICAACAGAGLHARQRCLGTAVAADGRPIPCECDCQ